MSSLLRLTGTDIVGIVFLGALARGYFDHLADLERRKSAFMEMRREMKPIIEEEVQLSFEEMPQIVSGLEILTFKAGPSGGPRRHGIVPARKREYTTLTPCPSRQPCRARESVGETMPRCANRNLYYPSKRIRNSSWSLARDHEGS
jgi:hypothetical protein